MRKAVTQLTFDTVIVRFGGELWIKKPWTRRTYERRLIDNMKRTLKRHEIPFKEIIRKHGRLYLKTNSPIEASSKLTRVFGIASVSPAQQTTQNLNDIIKTSLSIADQTLQQGNSFAIKCKRVGTQPYTSADICREVGRQILDKFGKKGNLRVDLKHPDVTLGIEIREENAFTYTTIIDGAGGMPLGTQPRLVGLLSGGIDSAVACWLTMKRGAPIVPVYFDNTPFTDETTTRRAVEVAKVLFDWATGFSRRMYIIPHGQNLAEFLEKCPHRFTCLLCKRVMYRIAEKIAEMTKVEGIVTGEAIGEQASQTIPNLRVLNQAVQKYPIHRPLLGFDKAETERIARKIGTYEPSSLKAKGCTAAPKKPATMAKPHEIIEAEEKLNIQQMVEASVQQLKTLNL